MTRSELDLTLDWAAAEGWNPGRDDADAFWATDPGGFHVAEVDGEVASTISVVRYGPRFAFLGLYIAAPAHRGQGHGLALWEHALGGLPAASVVGLDGVVDQQANYRRSGFTLAHRNARWGGAMPPLPDPPPQVRALGSADLPLLTAYDVFAAPRTDFLQSWTAGASTRRTVGWVEDHGLRGTVTIRACREGWKIGPLVADTVAVAEGLLAAAGAGLAGQPVFLDVPEPNAAARDLAARLGWAPAFETARMYRGADPGLPLDRVFGITTLELG